MPETNATMRTCRPGTASRRQTIPGSSAGRGRPSCSSSGYTGPRERHPPSVSRPVGPAGFPGRSPAVRAAVADGPHILAAMSSLPPITDRSREHAPEGQEDRRSRSLMMRACRREPVERTPVWLMRQAGRYLPEYRAVREKVGFMELCKSPRLSAEVMIATVERLGVDAAIIFSDLLPILEPMGMDLEFAAGEGPVIHNPIRGPGDVARLRELDSLDRLGFVMDVVRATRAGLDDSIPVIGFAGAPFTLAGYCIEGGTSRAWLHTKSLMYRHEAAWHDLMGRLARAVGRYLVAQFDAGAQIVQLFDSWVGCLGPDDYRRYVLPHTAAALAEAGSRGPVIHFATGNPSLLPLLAEAGGSVIGIDWRIGLRDAWRTVGHDRAVQGNLDPAVLLADRDTVRRRTLEVLEQAGRRPGHIFNLGHGVLPQTPVENVLELIATVKAGG
ncbi:MAG: uroporphyrinogen decarboxylase [Planctomycetia bacterium]|nr:uroporphyrinogen decarboxylase [Planctomycetia bacterium]